MASRRLTISSLLCDDDAPDTPLAGPSTAPPIPAPRVSRAELYAYSGRPHPNDYSSPYTPELNPLPAFHDAVPHSSPTYLRRRTPPPARSLDQPPSIPPSISRRSFKEIAFDDYRPSPVATPRSFSDVADHSARRRSPGIEVSRYPQSRTAIDALVHKQPHSYSSLHAAYPRPEPSPVRTVRPEAHYPSQPEAPPSQPYVRSPSHSPVASISPAHRRPSQSPLLSTNPFYAHSYPNHHHRVSASPVQPLSPALPTSFPVVTEVIYARQPLPETHYSPTLARPTLSALLTHSPPVSRASASSLPHILNSPVMSRGQGLDYSAGVHSTISPGMEALEALAEVAAQERKRVHADVDGATDASATLKGDTSPLSSPKVDHMEVDAITISKVDSIYAASQSSAAATRSPTRSPDARRVSSSRASPTADLTRASIPSIPVVENEEFVARSGPSATRPSSARDTTLQPNAKSERVDVHLATTGPLPDEHSDSLAASSPLNVNISPSPVDLLDPPLTVDTTSSRMPTDEEPPAKRRRSSPPESAPQPATTSVADFAAASPASHQTMEPSLAPFVPEIRKRWEPVSSAPSSPRPPPSPHQDLPKIEILSPVAHHSDSVEEISSKMSKSASSVKPKKVKTKEKPDGRKQTVKPKEKVAKPLDKVHTERKQPKDTLQRDEDVNEWLLEQTGGPLSPRMHTSGSNIGKASTSGPVTRPAEKHGSNSVSPTVPHSIATSARSKSAQTTKQKIKEARNHTRTPTPLALLEEELESTEPYRGNHRDHLKRTETGRKEHDMDVDSELDFVVNDNFTRHQEAADMDVDAELLSLLDDQPHPHTKPAPVSPIVPPTEPPPRRSQSPGKPALGVGTHTAPSEADSMPPPATPPTHSSKKTGDPNATATASTSSKKKETAPKPAPKKASALKTKAKPKPKPKVTKKDGSATPAPIASTSTSTLSVPTASGSARGKKTTPLAPGVAALTARRGVSTTGGASRSRSTSVMPGADGDKEADNAVDPGDDKLYCICKTSYDEDRVMIACDRCDEWYHTSCVNMPDLEVDLVDQFICPVCIAKHPELPLKTTYKTRCWAGLQHSNPASPEACHKAARGAFSKYCSDECGVKYIATRIEQWGGDKRALWEAVKNAEPRQAVVLRVLPEGESTVKAEGGPTSTEQRTEIVNPSQTPAQRETERLEAALAKVESKRELLTKDQEVLQWREKAVDLAAARAERVQECGWDQRLCFGDEEVLEFGSEVYETYEEDERRNTPDGMQIDGVGEWWCKGKKKCDRHAGWQKLRQAEVELERELQDAQRDRLTTQEREIRKQIEGVVDHSLSQKPSSGPGPLQPHNGDIMPKSVPIVEPQTNGTEKKGKKRKAEK